MSVPATPTEGAQRSPDASLERLRTGLAHAWLALMAAWICALHELGRLLLASAPFFPSSTLRAALIPVLASLVGTAALLYRKGWLSPGRGATALRIAALLVALAPATWTAAFGGGFAFGVAVYWWLPLAASALLACVLLAWHDLGSTSFQLGAIAVWLRPQALLAWLGAFFGSAVLLGHLSFAQSLPLVAVGLVAAADLADRYVARVHGGRRSLPWERRSGMVLAGAALVLLAWSPRPSASVQSKILDASLLLSLSDEYHHLEVTSAQGHTQWFIDGELKFSSLDYYRYYEPLVHPVLSRAPRLTRVVAFSSGLGLLEREILRYPAVARLEVVIDSPVGPRARDAVQWLARRARGSLVSPRTEVIVSEPSAWLARKGSRFDVAIVDLPDPSSHYWGKYYNRHFFGMLAKRLAPDGIVAMQATRSMRTAAILRNSAEAAGWTAKLLSAPIPSMGEWQILLASPRRIHEPLRPLPLGLKFLDPEVMHTLAAAAPGVEKPANLPVSLLHDPQALDSFLDEADSGQ